jgi:hypothetical protein
MEIVSSPTSAVKRIPNPAPSPLDQVSGSSTQETTAREFIQPNPTAKAPATPAEKVASAPTALPRSGTGHRKRDCLTDSEKEAALGFL